MDTETKVRNRGTPNGDFVLQWGSSKRLRGVKKESIAAANVSGVLKKAIRADRRVIRAGKQSRRGSKQFEGDGRSSSARKLTKRYTGASSAPKVAEIKKQNSNEPVESSAVPRAENILSEKSDFTATKVETVNVEIVDKGCLSAETFHDDPRSLEIFLLPKFMIALSHKEKEEDFMTIKGSKLPQRPKKRAKHIQKALHCVSPGAWLCELSLDRYEVKEKKSLRKKPLGLKAMDSVGSDSDKS